MQLIRLLEKILMSSPINVSITVDNMTNNDFLYCGNIGKLK